MDSTTTNPSTDNWLVAVGQVDPSAPQTLIQLDSGRIIALPTALLLDASSDQLARAEEGEPSAVVIPIIEEQLSISKRTVPLESVRLIKTVEETPREITVELLQERWDVRRVPFDTEVSQKTDVRHEGDVTVYPLFEERTISRKALFLVEEVHVQKRSESRQETISTTVKRDVITVERTSL